MRKALLFAGIVAGVAVSAAPAQADVTIALDNQYNLVAGRKPIYGYRGSDAPLLVQPGNTTSFKIGAGTNLVLSTHPAVAALGLFNCVYAGSGNSSSRATVIRVKIELRSGGPNCNTQSSGGQGL